MWKFKKRDKCYLCGNVEVEIISLKTRDNPGLKVVKCLNCKLIQSENLPIDITQYYENEYREDYSLFADEVELAGYIKDATQRFEKLLTLIKQPKQKTLLDVGCGNGSFIEHASKFIAQVAGIEPHNRSREKLINKGYRIYSDILDIDSNLFDIITCFHVLEHTDDPIEFLKNMKRLLKPGGIIFLEVPCVTDALLTVYDIPEFKDFLLAIRASVLFFTGNTEQYYKKRRISQF